MTDQQDLRARLPELPEPVAQRHAASYTNILWLAPAPFEFPPDGMGLYTADQMRAYAAATLAKTQEGEQSAAGERVDWRKELEAILADDSLGSSVDKAWACLACGAWTPLNHPEAHDHEEGCPAHAEWKRRHDWRVRLQNLIAQQKAPEGAADLAAAKQQGPEEMSPDFTDSARGAIAWVLWHHQGGSSAIGQPLRFALGMSTHEPLPDWRIAEAKRYAAWAGVTTADFRTGAIDSAAPGGGGQP